MIVCQNSNSRSKRRVPLGKDHLTDLALHHPVPEVYMQADSNTGLSEPQLPGVDVQSSCNGTPGMLVSPYTPGLCYGQAVFRHTPLIGVYRHHACRLIRLADDPARDYYGSGHS